MDAMKSLFESGLINEETRDAITEAWDTKLKEAKSTLRTELREEFSNRYEHDKSVMVEAIETMVTESLTQELTEFATDKSNLAKERVAFKRQVKESAAKFEKFLMAKLAEEIQEFRGDRKVQLEATKKLENFVIENLATEIAEFDTDKKAVVETKVRLISEAKVKMAEIQGKFVKRSAKLVKEAIDSNLNKEMSQLKEDITAARENMFGRKLFEAFASEFAFTHLNENKEVQKLHKKLATAEKAVNESRKLAAKKAKLVESKDTEIKMIKENTTRANTVDSLLENLNEEKAGVMRELLEGVQTGNIQKAFDKYLPAVLNGTDPVQKRSRTKLTESRKSVTGNRKTAAKKVETDDSNIVDIKRLAGL